MFKRLVVTAFIISTIKTLEQELKSIDCMQYYKLKDKLSLNTTNKRNSMKQNKIMNEDNKLLNNNKYNGMNLIYEGLTLLWIYMLIILYTSQSNKIAHFLELIVH